MIVVDANVIAYWSIEGDLTESARKLRELEPIWAVPALCRHELANVLVTYVKHGGMSIGDARTLWPHILSIVTDNEYETDLMEVISLAEDFDISAYDAQYVLLSKRLGKPLVTQDRRLRQRCPAVILSIAQYINKTVLNG